MLRNLEYYKKDIDKTFDMMTKSTDDAFDKKGGNVTFRALPPEDLMFKDRDLTTFNGFESDKDISRFVNDTIERYHNSFEARKDIDDNCIPALGINIGIGDFSAFVTGEIIFNSATSWSTHPLKELRDFKNLPPLGTSKWYKRFLKILDELLKATAHTGIPFQKGFFSPLDLANALVGERIYMDFYDDPEGVHELLDYCATATIKFAEDIYKVARKYLGNHKYGMYYLDGKINMSEDIACMVSPNIYQEFCAPHTQRVIDHFGKGYMHCHSRAMYLVKEICSLNSVVDLWLPTDPNQTRPIDVASEVVKDANGTSVSIDCTSFEDIKNNFDDLIKGNFSVCLPVKDVQEGIELTERFNKLKKH